MRLELELEAKNKDNPVNNDKNKNKESLSDEIRKKTIDPNELIHTATKIRLVLIKLKKPWNDFKEELFSEYKPGERISIKELTKIFQRKPLNLTLADGEELGRYLVETKEQKEIIYDKYKDNSVSDVRLRLDSIVNINYPKNFSENISRISEDAIRKISDRLRYLQSLIEDVLVNGKLDYIKWFPICSKACPELLPIERDCLVLIMLDETNDPSQMIFSV